MSASHVGRSPVGKTGLLSMGLVLLAACAKPSTASGATPGANPVLGAPVEGEHRQAYRALERAVEADPTSEAVSQAADRLLAQNPPPTLRARAVFAKANRLYRLGEDASAAVLAADGLVALDEVTQPDEPLHLALQRIRLQAVVRSGDPAEGLRLLRAMGERLPPQDRWGLLARARDRRGEREGAVTAYLQWRPWVEDDPATVAYIHRRVRVLTRGLSPRRLRALARTLSGSAAQCLQVRAGAPRPKGAPAWVADCEVHPAVVGVLLPRSGRYAALADTQLAAASAAVEVLGKTPEIQVVWADSGSAPDSAERSARRLLDRGAEVIVGPVGPRNVRAVAGVVGQQAIVIVPGEGGAESIGMAPSLEQRVGLLLDHAARLDPPGVVVLAPDNAYGRRATAAARASAPSKSVKLLKTQQYSSDTTSFASDLDAVASLLRRGAVLVVPDRLGRVELVLRQLRRMDLGEVPVLTTGEGASMEVVGPRQAVLEGVWLVPVAAPDEDSARFVEAYTAREGAPPGDQALLVWRALKTAFHGSGGARTPPPVLFRIQGGRLVPTSPGQVAVARP